MLIIVRVAMTVHVCFISKIGYKIYFTPVIISILINTQIGSCRTSKLTQNMVASIMIFNYTYIVIH